MYYRDEYAQENSLTLREASDIAAGLKHERALALAAELDRKEHPER